MTENNNPGTQTALTPEVKRAIARAVVEMQTKNGETPASYLIEMAELDYVPVPRRVRWWERFRRKGTAI